MSFQVPYVFIILLIFELTRTHYFVIYYRKGNIISSQKYTTHLVSIKIERFMKKKIMVEKSTCSVGATIQLIGGKYKAVILWHLMGHTLRYSELHKLIAAATDKMLAQQLRELERDGLVHREVYPVVPPKTEYSLTAFGESIAPILDAMCTWGKEHLELVELEKKV